MVPPGYKCIANSTAKPSLVQTPFGNRKEHTLWWLDQIPVNAKRLSHLRPCAHRLGGERNHCSRSGLLAFSAACLRPYCYRVKRTRISTKSSAAVSTRHTSGNSQLRGRALNRCLGRSTIARGIISGFSSEAHKVLINDMFGANPAVLGFPICHYLSRIIPLQSR